MILCGFAGIGKSTVAKNFVGWVDLESTPFKKDWDTYARVAIHMHNSGYNVMLSCHKEIRDKLIEEGIPFYTVIPTHDAKGTYLRRYKRRGNTIEFIKEFEKSFDEFLEEIESDHRLNIIRLPIWSNSYLASLDLDRLSKMKY